MVCNPAVPLRYLKRTGNILVYDGVLPFLWRMIVKCLSRWGTLKLVNFYGKDLTAPLASISPAVDMVIGEATAADIEPLANLFIAEQRRTASGAGHDQEVIILDLLAERFRQGWKCYVGRVQGEIVHCTWLVLSWAESIPQRFIVVQRDEAYTADACTAAAWRGRRIHPYVKAHILRDLQRAGYRTAYTLVHAECRSSIRVQRQLGYEALGTVLSFASHRTGKTRVWTMRGTPASFLRLDIPTSGGSVLESLQSRS